MADSPPDRKTNQGSDTSDVFASPFHATCVAHNGRGLLIMGASGSGKSSLGLQLIALGADLVADDRVKLTQTKAAILADAPMSIKGLIEARGIGVLNAPSVGSVPVHLLVDLDTEENSRLPELHMRRLGAHNLHLVHNSSSPHFPAALLLYVAHGRSA